MNTSQSPIIYDILISDIIASVAGLFGDHSKNGTAEKTARLYAARTLGMARCDAINRQR
ncbi:hypothetical protein [Pectobacterium jejuense]|uniref:hypothetical protein n=1 Tax=Pectobacterium jejuense TaxID=2974022 RepID=UPI002280367F|nr:hypothetical protein [Pectobacterium jejuense]MCY9848201.1 hypothetical protein [Pectobacterium jejuense]